MPLLQKTLCSSPSTRLSCGLAPEYRKSEPQRASGDKPLDEPPERRAARLRDNDKAAWLNCCGVVHKITAQLYVAPSHAECCAASHSARTPVGDQEMAIGVQLPNLRRCALAYQRSS